MALQWKGRVAYKEDTKRARSLSALEERVEVAWHWQGALGALRQMGVTGLRLGK